MSREKARPKMNSAEQFLSKYGTKLLKYPIDKTEYVKFLFCFIKITTFELLSLDKK